MSINIWEYDYFSRSGSFYKCKLTYCDSNTCQNKLTPLIGKQLKERTLTFCLRVYIIEGLIKDDTSSALSGFWK